MNTRKILLISTDKETTEVIKISALTLTKLNCQVTIENAYDYKTAIENSRSENLDMIIIDNDISGDTKTEKIDTLKIISEIRKNEKSKNKKIILLYSVPVNKDEIFSAGCDSIMSKEEFKRVVNNIMVF